MQKNAEMQETELAEITRMLRFFVKVKLDELRDEKQKSQQDLVLLLHNSDFPSGAIAELLETGINSVSPVISRAKREPYRIGAKAK